MALGAALAHWLRESQQPDGRVVDSTHGEPGSYADGFAALAFGLMALRTGDRSWIRPCRTALAITRRRPRHSEFDQLARLLLASSIAEAPQVTAIFGSTCVPAAAEVDLYRGKRLVSHNWIAMRALNYSLRGRLTGRKSDRTEAARLWESVLGWQTPDGLFIDSPGGEATPTTYHAKFCAMLTVAFSETDVGSEAMLAALRRGLDALARLISPAGVLVPFGRSRGTLFGSAAAILALSRGALLCDEPSYGLLAHRMLARLRDFLCSDGHIPCVLNRGETHRQDWDVYVNNADYNAYAAALLLMADRSGISAAPGCLASRGSLSASGELARDHALAVDRIGPILTVRHGNLFAAFSSEGQTVPFGTPFFCDHRYYGMQLLWIEEAGQSLFEPAPYRWRGGQDRVLLVDPTMSAWIPYVTARDQRYCVRRYGDVRVRHTGSVVTLEGEGQPDAYQPVSRWQRGAAAWLSPATGRPAAVFRTRRLPGVSLHREIILDLDRRTIGAVTDVSGRLPQAARLELGAHEWSWTAPRGQRLGPPVAA
jgi:hypothetical protein